MEAIGGIDPAFHIAIAAGLGTIGYVANSTKTVIGESLSAGRLYVKPVNRSGTLKYPKAWRLCL